MSQLTHLETFKAIQQHFAPAKVNILFESRFTIQVEVKLGDTTIQLWKVPYCSISSRSAIRRTINDIAARLPA